MGSVSVSQSVSSRGVDATISWGTGPEVTVEITGSAGCGERAQWRIRGKNPDTTIYIGPTDSDTGTFDAEDGTSYAFQAVWGSVSDGQVFTVNFDKPRTLTIVEGTGASVTCSRSNGSTVYDGDTFTVTANTVTGYNTTTFTVSGATLVSGSTYKVTGDVTITASASVKSYTLTINQGNNSTVTAYRTSSPSGGATTGYLSNGATIYHFDVLKIIFEPLTGYDISCTVNTYEFESESEHTVTGDTVITSSTTVKYYTLTLNPDTGTEILVYRTSSPLQGADTGELVDGDTIYHSDVLEINFESGAEYEIVQKLVNQEDFTSGDSHTVAGDVEIVTTAGLTGIVHIYDGTEFIKHLIYIYDGTSWSQYIPYVYSGSSWVICS